MPSGSDSTCGSKDNNTRASTTNYGHVADDAVEYKYGYGVLTWGSFQLKDEEVIAVTKVEEGDRMCTIFSLAPADPKSDSKQAPFQLRTTSASNLPQDFLERYLFQGLPPHLQPSNVIHVLISTLSGMGQAPDFFDYILEPLLRAIGLADTKYNVVWTRSADSVKEFAKSELLVGAIKGQKQTVLVLSGDGGMVDTINGLLETESPGTARNTYTPPVLSQLPLGTGNALFHSLHRPSLLPSIYMQGLRTLLHGKPKPLPIFRVSFSPGARLLSNEGQNANPLVNNTLHGAVVVSYGLHATLVADSDTTEYRKHGDKRFGLVAKDLLFPEDGSPPHAYKAEVTLFKPDGNEVIQRKEHGYILASLVSNLEKTFTISPASKPLDGCLRVVHFAATSGNKTMEIMKEAYNDGNHVSMEWEDEEGEGNVDYEEVEGLRIDFQEQGQNWKWRRCCIDGLIVGVEEGGWMEVRKVKPGDEPLEVVVDV